MTRKKKSIKADGKANKGTRMGFRATEEERQIIFQKSRECGISQSEYIRERALNHRPKRTSVRAGDRGIYQHRRCQGGPDTYQERSQRKEPGRIAQILPGSGLYEQVD